MRIIKTVIAVFICFLIDSLRFYKGFPFYSAIAAILCMQQDTKNSIEQGRNRAIATVVGGLYGMIFLLFERYVVDITYELLRYLIIAIIIIPIIKTSLLLKIKKSSYIMCVVFLSVVVTHMDDISPIEFALNRMLDTVIGITVSLLINITICRNDVEKEDG